MTAAIETLSDEVRQEFISLRRAILNHLKANSRPRRFRDKLVGTDCVIDRLNGKPVEREIFYFYAPGCIWARGKGPCLPCGHHGVTSGGRRISTDQIIEQFDAAIKFLPKSRRMISLYNAGSFLNNQEIPQQARIIILKKLSALPGMKRIILESLPEFVTMEKLEEIKSCLPEVEVEIGIGVDSVTEHVRECCINKGASLDSQIEALETVELAGFLPLAYVLLKPVFLSETEAIEEAVKSIEFIKNKGYDRISLEPLSIQRGSFAAYLYERELFDIPSPWSIQAVVKRIKNLDIHLRIGGWQYRPKPTVSIQHYTCKLECHDKFQKAIESLNGRGDLETLLSIDCECKSSWRSRCSNGMRFPDNIKNFLSVLKTANQ